MALPPFELERWFDGYEPDAGLTLAESGVRSPPADQFDHDVVNSDTSSPPTVLRDSEPLSPSCTTATPGKSFSRVEHR